ncbi:T9SS type A sorting domain-containing protein [Pontibacter sp. E15-1]|uniref:T9SS type A sorting domain-containing protein n=1 Tax=Pontibacter sp. E15-1 TaxID=2919918 RepID=UPI001F4FC503|nr:T9SS type A sorting domain-containing protein [Pontibacter sp. E15-1]MCJ8164896.1 T9SS type A sorting domain-containing protein [Pontibacter sp. E15-1]
MNKLFTRVSHVGMALCLNAALFSQASLAQVSMEKTKTSYAQNFDALPATKDGVWENGTSTYLDGWYVQRTKSTNSIAISPGNVVAGNLYSFGATGSSERALGAQSSLNAGEFAWGLLLQNNTGGTINFITVSFYGEQWRISNKTAGEHRTSFYYAVSSDKASFKLSPKSDDGWIPYPDLDFKSPHFYTEGKALDGNAAANRKFLSAVLAVNIPNGHYMMLRWKDWDDLEADHGLAIDDFAMTWSVEEADAPAVVLPVELARFTAYNRGAAVVLEWLTASEKNNDHFLIERSTNGQTFDGIAKVAGKGTTSQETSYSFSDMQPLDGTTYYRLKQVDGDSSYTYSRVVAVERAAGVAITKVYPTVTSDYLQIDLAQPDGMKEMLVLDMVGKRLIRQPLNSAILQATVDVRNLDSGTYVLVLLDEQGKRKTTRFLKR